MIKLDDTLLRIGTIIIRESSWTYIEWNTKNPLQIFVLQRHLFVLRDRNVQQQHFSEFVSILYIGCLGGIDGGGVRLLLVLDLHDVCGRRGGRRRRRGFRSFVRLARLQCRQHHQPFRSYLSRQAPGGPSSHGLSFVCCCDGAKSRHQSVDPGRGRVPQQHLRGRRRRRQRGDGRLRQDQQQQPPHPATVCQHFYRCVALKGGGR